MAVKFCFASGCSPKISGCGIDHAFYPETHEKDPEIAKCAPVRLGDLGSLRYKTYTFDRLLARVEAAKGLPDDTKDIWRSRIICILAPIETIFCINFIPSNPYALQTLQVVRMNDPNESASSYPIYFCEFSNYKFMLPKEQPDQVFDLSKWDFSEIEAEPLILALQYLKNEKSLKGLALTLQNHQGNLSTYVWIKP